MVSLWLLCAAIAAPLQVFAGESGPHVAGPSASAPGGRASSVRSDDTCGLRASPTSLSDPVLIRGRGFRASRPRSSAWSAGRLACHVILKCGGKINPRQLQVFSLKPKNRMPIRCRFAFRVRRTSPAKMPVDPRLTSRAEGLLGWSSSFSPPLLLPLLAAASGAQRAGRHTYSIDRAGHRGASPLPSPKDLGQVLCDRSG